MKKEDFIFLSKRIGTDGKRLARQLNINDQDVKDIEKTSSRQLEGFHDVFRLLKILDGSVKVNKIKMACKEIGVTQEVLEYLSEKQLAYKNV